MAGTVEDIKAKTDIVQIISERINVKKAGKHFKALCPFHGEKTASFMISPELQIYKCFGCGLGGDAIDFLERFEGMDFNEAISYLSERTGIKLESSAFQPKKDKEKIIEINELASKYYHYLLVKHKLGKDALTYLTQKRKLTMATIEKFRIGFSPNNQKIFENFFIDKKKIHPNDLVLAGVCYQKYGRVVERFSQRVVFPLFDHRGNIVGFSGRIMPGSNPEMAKYINTPETPAYHKSEILFGLNFTKDEIKKAGFAIITEGELDAISPWQRGIKNIVAIKGSALTEAHARLLSRFAKNITLALDADFAGNSAAKRGIEIAQKLGLKVKVAVLKGYKDPDEMAIADIDKFSKSVKSAVSVYDFIINSAIEKYDYETIEGKVDVAKEVIPFLTRIEDEIVKAYYIEALSKKLKIPYESIYSEVEKSRITKITKPDIAKQEKDDVENARDRIEEMLLILLLLTDPNKIAEDQSYFKSTFIKKIVKELGIFLKNRKFQIKEFAQSLPEELKVKFNDIYLINSIDFDNLGKSEIDKLISSLKSRLELNNVTNKQKEIIQKIKEGERDKDRELVTKLQKDLNDLMKTKLKLEGKLN